MGEFFINNLYTVLLIPLWIFLVIIFGRFFNAIQSKKIISTITLASTLYGIIFAVGTFLYIYKTPDFVYDSSYNFIKIQDFSLNLGIYVDNLSVLMLLLVTVISFFVQLYSSIYMEKDGSFPRFFGYLNLFNFSMIGLVLSPNLFQNYVFWELVGISSYLLIGFWYKKPSASDAAKKAFLMNRIGDFGLLAGTIAISYFMYQYSNSPSLAVVPFANINDIAGYLFSYTNEFVFVVISILLLMGAIAKSAQFPLHTWLPDAMEGPTPVSALIHSATMVAAGVYLIARLFPIFSLSEGVMYLIAAIGLFTAIISAFFAITQNDFKRILAYSTSSQLGLMFMALGLGLYSAAIFHLVVHAFIKSMLFLSSGIVIHSASGNQDIRFMGGARKTLPLVAFCYLIGCIAISGIFFSGFYSKEAILGGLFDSNRIIWSALFLIVSLLTAFYMFRSYFLVFEGSYRGSKALNPPEKHIGVSIVALSGFVILLGTLINNNISAYLNVKGVIAQVHSLVSPVIISLMVALSGLILATILYSGKIKAFKIPLLYNLSSNKLYIDNFYDFVSKKMYHHLSRIFAFIDKYLVDGLVILAALITRSVSWIFAKMQTGNFQSYIAYSVVFLAIVFATLMFAYTLIISYSLASGL